MAASYESWIGSDTSIGTEQLGSSWDAVQLGQVALPGVCSIEGFKIGQQIDVQKKRKKDKPRIRDNGTAPCNFKIIVEINASQWSAWQKVLPFIQPQRPGALRTPLAILHPLPNSNGIDSVYVQDIEYDSPTARKGMKITIGVHEWFEEEKDTNTNKTVKPYRYTKQDAEYVDYVQKQVDPRNPDNIRENSFFN